jgi:hypothetical protein
LKEEKGLNCPAIYWPFSFLQFINGPENKPLIPNLVNNFSQSFPVGLGYGMYQNNRSIMEIIDDTFVAIIRPPLAIGYPVFKSYRPKASLITQFLQTQQTFSVKDAAWGPETI